MLVWMVVATNIATKLDWPLSNTWYPDPAQLPGRLFSPSDISKKLSHHFLLHFPIGMGFYDHHTKYQGVFQELL